MSQTEPLELKCRAVGNDECLWLSVQITNGSADNLSHHEAKPKQTDDPLHSKLSLKAKAKAKPILIIELGVALANEPSSIVGLAIDPNSTNWIRRFCLRMAADGQFLLGDRGWTPSDSFFEVEVPVIGKSNNSYKASAGEVSEMTASGTAAATTSTIAESRQKQVYTMEIDSRSQTINYYVDGEFLIATPPLADEWAQDFQQFQPRVKINQVGYQVDIVSTPQYEI